MAPPAREARPLPGQRKKVDIPSYRVREHDIIEVRAKSRTMFRRAGAGPGPAARDRAGVAGGDPSQMKILVHALPSRQVIDTQVQEAADRRALLQVGRHVVGGGLPPDEKFVGVI
jgi:hypothetical protein